MRAPIDHPAFAQFFRFVVAGFGVTGFSILVYLFYAVTRHVAPLLASFALNRWWVFKT